MVTVHLCFNHHEAMHRANMGGSVHRTDRDLMRIVSCKRLHAWLVEQGATPLDADLLNLRGWFRQLIATADVHDLRPPGFKEDKHEPRRQTTRARP